jgi:hypothetical protein
MAEHALLPWSESDGYLFAGNNTVYLRSGTYEWACDRGPHYETAVANAAFIVKACNAHGELVECLSGFVLNERLLGDEHFRGVQERLVELARAALAKAGAL